MKISMGIASTTHVDKQGDKMTKHALLSMCRQINDHYIPYDIEHRGIYIGVILCAKVREMDDGEWALYIVAGIFESNGEREKYVYGETNTIYRQYLDLI